VSRRPGELGATASRRTIVGLSALGVLVVVIALVWSVLGGFKIQLGGASGAPVVTAAGGPPQVVGTVTAGPVCPVEASPPDPQCAPRPVAGAVIVVTDTSGLELGRTTTEPGGSYSLFVGETGAVIVSALPVPGLPGTPSPVSITLPAPSTINRVDLEYDTGIR
jgi:hypothetical protein